MKTMKRMVTPILCVGFAGILGAWQGPLYDTVTVDLPFEVRVQDQVLKPGEYRIQEQRSAADTGVLLIYDNEGTEFKTSVMTIDTMDKKAPEDTKVVLQQIGDDYYFDKVWIQGKNYGYEFVFPESVRSRQREVQQSRNLPARWERSEGLSRSMTQLADAGQNLAGDAGRIALLP
jgi:hypothetical protein